MKNGYLLEDLENKSHQEVDRIKFYCDCKYNAKSNYYAVLIDKVE